MTKKVITMLATVEFISRRENPGFAYAHHQHQHNFSARRIVYKC